MVTVITGMDEFSTDILAEDKHDERCSKIEGVLHDVAALKALFADPSAEPKAALFGHAGLKSEDSEIDGKLRTILTSFGAEAGFSISLG